MNTDPTTHFLQALDFFFGKTAVVFADIFHCFEGSSHRIQDQKVSLTKNETSLLIVREIMGKNKH